MTMDSIMKKLNIKHYLFGRMFSCAILLYTLLSCSSSSKLTKISSYSFEDSNICCLTESNAIDSAAYAAISLFPLQNGLFQEDSVFTVITRQLKVPFCNGKIQTVPTTQSVTIDVVMVSIFANNAKFLYKAGDDVARGLSKYNLNNFVIREGRLFYGNNYSPLTDKGFEMIFQALNRFNCVKLLSEEDDDDYATYWIKGGPCFTDSFVDYHPTATYYFIKHDLSVCCYKITTGSNDRVAPSELVSLIIRHLSQKQ